jgi:carbon-monoxide dehydrogenase small subunit
MRAKMKIDFVLNQKDVEIEVENHTLSIEIIHALEEDSLTRKACDEKNCGSCLILLDDLPFYACRLPAYALQGHEIETAKGIRNSDQFKDIEVGFIREGIVPCRFCAPSKLVLAEALIRQSTGKESLVMEQFLPSLSCNCTSILSFKRAINYASEYRRRTRIGS